MLGHRMVFVADEYYLLADRPFPTRPTTCDFPMYEDGIGMAGPSRPSCSGPAQATPRGDAAGSSRSADARPAGISDAEYEPYRGVPGHRRPAAAHRPRRERPGRHPHRPTRPRSCGRWSSGWAGPTSGS